MVAEVVESLAAKAGSVVLDGTCGTGGHCLALAEAMEFRGTLVAVDRDPLMLQIAQKRLSERIQDTVALRLVTKNIPYSACSVALEENDIAGVDGLLLDLGVNSLHLEHPERGFSFSKPGPLDARFNPGEPGTKSVGELVNTASEADLADWIFHYSDERLARQIAKAIVKAREKAPLQTTAELAELVTYCYPPKKRHLGIHPATRTFQALRIAANRELEELEQGLHACLSILNPGGHMTVLSFHSAEDRMVKRVFDEYGSPREDPNNVYSATTTDGLEFEVLSRGAVKPTDEEVERNPRARSTRLRTIRRKEAA